MDFKGNCRCGTRAKALKNKSLWNRYGKLTEIKRICHGVNKADEKKKCDENAAFQNMKPDFIVEITDGKISLYYGLEQIFSIDEGDLQTNDNVAAKEIIKNDLRYVC